jgi:hypothetical protein
MTVDISFIPRTDTNAGTVRFPSVYMPGPTSTKYGFTEDASVILAIAALIDKNSPTPGFCFTRRRWATDRSGSPDVSPVAQVSCPDASTADRTCPPTGLNPGHVIAVSFAWEAAVDTVVNFSVPDETYSILSVRVLVDVMEVASISPE